jgi:hypothetical protein
VSKDKSCKTRKAKEEKPGSVRKVLANKPEFKKATYPEWKGETKTGTSVRGGRSEGGTSASRKEKYESMNKESVLTFKAEQNGSASRWTGGEAKQARGEEEDRDRVGKKFFDGGMDIPSNLGDSPLHANPFDLGTAHTAHGSTGLSEPLLSPITRTLHYQTEPYGVTQHEQPDISKKRFVQSKIMDRDSSNTPSKAFATGIESTTEPEARFLSRSNNKSVSQSKQWLDKNIPGWRKPGNQPAERNESSKSPKRYAHQPTNKTLREVQDRSASPVSRSKIAQIEPEQYNRLMKKSNVTGSALGSPGEEHTGEAHTFQPEINRRSQVLADHLARGNFETVHDRLFHKGIELLHKKQVEHEQQQPSKRYPFRPLTNNPSPKQTLTRGDIDRFFAGTSGPGHHQEKRHCSKPKETSPTPRKSSPPKHKYTLAEVEAFRQQQQIYRRYLLQVFDFLDYRHTGMVHSSTVRTELIEDSLRELLRPIISAVVEQKKYLDFPSFCSLVDSHDLSHVVYKVFGFVDAFPSIKNVPSIKKKEFKFK